jgi:hypothetical protein
LGGLGRMKDDESAQLSRRVPGSTRSGPSQPVKRNLSDTDVHRIKAAIDAEHAGSEMPGQREPNTEPIPAVTVSGPGTKRAGDPPAAQKRQRAAKAPRAEEALRSAKALRAAEELRVAEQPRANQPPRVEEPASVTGRLHPEPVVAAEPMVAPEPVVAAEPIGAPEHMAAAGPSLATEQMAMPESLLATEQMAVPEPSRAAKPLDMPMPSLAAVPVVAPEPVMAAAPVVAPEPVMAAPPVVAPEPVHAEQPVLAARPVTAAEPPQRMEPRTSWPSAEPAPGTIGWLWPEDTATRGGTPRWKPPRRWTLSGWWRYRTATLVALGVVVLVAGGLVVGMSLHSSPAGTGAHSATSGPTASTHSTGKRHRGHAKSPARGGGSAAASGSNRPKNPSKVPKPTITPGPAVAPNRAAAATWTARQVGAAAVVACDAQTCAALTHSGFPAGHEVQIGTKSGSLSNAGLIVVTPELRTLITATNRSLGADVAPTDLASFGSGNAKVTVQPVDPSGAAAYEAALSQSVQTRKTVGEQLLNTKKVSASASAEADLQAGAVDPRLLLVIKAMANLEPVAVVNFADSGPGASAGVPFRLMALGEKDPAASVSASAYLQAMLQLLKAHATFPAFSHVTQVTLSNGQKVVEVEYDAPSPLKA